MNCQGGGPSARSKIPRIACGGGFGPGAVRDMWHAGGGLVSRAEGTWCDEECEFNDDLR